MGSPSAYAFTADFLSEPDASTLMQTLLVGCQWRQEWIHLFGRSVCAPRLVDWYGDPGTRYRYSGTDHEATGWLAPIDRLRQRLVDVTGERFNFVLLNRYRDGADSMGWHTDDERSLSGTVASVSLGAERRFLLRDRGKTATPLDLAHGSLLLLPVRAKIAHTLPKTRKPVGERINLSFRAVDLVD